MVLTEQSQNKGGYAGVASVQARKLTVDEGCVLVESDDSEVTSQTRASAENTPPFGHIGTLLDNRPRSQSGEKGSILGKVELIELSPSADAALSRERLCRVGMAQHTEPESSLEDSVELETDSMPKGTFAPRRRIKKLSQATPGDSPRVEPAVSDPLVTALGSLSISPDLASSPRGPHAGPGDDEPPQVFLRGTSNKLSRKTKAQEPCEALTASATPESAGAPDLCMEGGEMCDGRFLLSGDLAAQLYPWQRDGLQWLWGLYKLGSGGILGDDMGLGKTLQMAAFLRGVFDGASPSAKKRALVVAPKTLLEPWERELERVGLEDKLRRFYGASPLDKEDALRSIYRRGGVLLTTYGMVTHNPKALTGGALEGAQGDHTWDFVILDEGHTIKNPKTQIAQTLRQLPARQRILVTGTPVQNKLQEMWALFDFCCHGLLCDDVKSFKAEYEGKIAAGRDRSASHREREVGIEAEKALRKKIAPYFLRREKGVLFGNDTSSTAIEASGASGAATLGADDCEGEGAGGAHGAPATTSSSSSTGAAPKVATLSKKNDLIVWLKLTSVQRKLYMTFLRSNEVKRVLSKTGSALTALTVLKKICQHPVLLRKGATSHNSANKLDDFIDDSELEGADYSLEEEATSGEEGDGRPSLPMDAEFSQMLETALNTVHLTDEEDGNGADSDDTVDDGDDQGDDKNGDTSRDQGSRCGGDPSGGREGKARGRGRARRRSGICHEAVSCKISFLRRLLKELAGEGHRTLVFSQTRMVLDIVEETVRELGLVFRRIDGTVVRAGERARRVQEFQTNEAIRVFLLTSRVGGLGLTLTGADRVVIVDPAWNPSLDDQSVDRAYRLGQSKDVVVYRLITCGTMEEKIYRKQVFKAGLMRTATQSRDHQRYFTQQELRELFAAKEDKFDYSETRQQLGKLHGDQTQISSALAAHIASLNQLGADGVSYHDQLFSREKDSSEAAVKADYEADGRSRRGGVPGAHTHGLFRSAGAFSRGNVDADRRMTSWDDCLLATAKQGIFSGSGASTSSSPPVVSLVSEANEREREEFLQRCAREQKLASVTEQISRQKLLLRTGLKLPDGGKKILDRIQELEAEKAALIAQTQPSGASQSSAIVILDSPVAAPQTDAADKPGSVSSAGLQQFSTTDQGLSSLDGLMKTLKDLSVQR